MAQRLNGSTFQPFNLSTIHGRKLMLSKDSSNKPLLRRAIRAFEMNI
jgi:hypothetical protein